MSHFTTLVNIEFPTGISTTCPNLSIEEQALKAMLKMRLTQNTNDSLAEFQLKMLAKRHPSEFDQAIEDDVGVALEPFCECTEESCYLEFVDETDEYRPRYEHDKIQRMQMVNGKIYEPYNPDFTRKFQLMDGVVYQRDFGPLRHFKRTKKAKQIKVLPPTPLTKMYATFEACMDDRWGIEYNESQNAYGYFCNPNAEWDWYSIGGRWPFQFLVSAEEDCVVRSTDETGDAPDGYAWVAGARKSAIQWDLMKSLALEKATGDFYVLEKWYETDIKPNHVDSLCRRVDDGIAGWQTMPYIKGETLAEHLQRIGILADRKYFVDVYSFLQNGEWISKGDMGWFGFSSNDKEESDWVGILEAYIDQIPDDDFIVSVDCHI